MNDARPPAPFLPAPPGLWRLFVTASRIGIAGFGGVLPLIRRSLVDDLRVLSGHEFNTLLGLCQLLPGSNVINLAVCVGARLHGARGAIIFSSGLLVAPFMGMMVLAMAYAHWGHLAIVQDTLRGVAAAGAGLLFATAYRMARNVREPVIYLPFALLILLGLALLHLPLVPLMTALLAAAASIAYQRRPASGNPP